MKKNILIFGAGIAGKLVADELEAEKNSEINVIGFIDDYKKKSTKIGKFHVLGSKKETENLVKKFGVTEIIIAIPSARGDEIRNFIKKCR